MSSLFFLTSRHIQDLLAPQQSHRRKGEKLFCSQSRSMEELFPPCFQNQKDEIKYQPGFTPISPPIFLCSQPKEEQSITRSEPEMIREQNGNKAVTTWE